MSKVSWFSIAILLCSALVETLICNRCRRFKLGFGCVDKKPALTCTAKSGQKCKIVKSFREGTIKGLVKQACTKSINECGLHVFNQTVGPVETTCCDDRDRCNTP